MKKIMMMALAILFSVFFLCTNGSAKSAAASSKPIEIIVAHATPAQAPLSQNCKRWGDMIEEKSGGRVKFVYYWSYTLMPPNEYMKGVLTGAADVIYMLSQIANYMPISYNIMYMPFMGYPSMEAAVQIYRELYEKFPEISNEFSKVKLLTTTTAPPAHLHMTKKKVTEIPDLKGTKILLSSTAGTITNMVKSWGAAPVQISPADIAMSLNTGIVDGWIDHFPVVTAFGCMEMVNHHTIFGESGIAMAMDALIMNRNTWNKLPNDIQKIIDEACDWYTDAMVKSNHKDIERSIGLAEKENHTFTYLSPEDIGVWAATATKFHQTWIDEMEAKGIPGKAIYDEAKRLIEKYKK